MIVGAIGTNGAVAVATVGIVAIPAGLIGGAVYVINRHRQDKKDRALIDKQLSERGYIVPREVLAQTQVTKSAFFPITPAPTSLLWMTTYLRSSSRVSDSLEHTSKPNMS